MVLRPGTADGASAWANNEVGVARIENAIHKPPKVRQSDFIRKSESANGASGISDIEGKAVMGSGERAGKRASFNGANGISDIEGKAAMGSGERAGKQASFNGASGISDIEGKAAMGSGERAGKQASFKSVN